jgi:hypothetical protein
MLCKSLPPAIILCMWAFDFSVKAQTGIDLSSPVLQANADLPQYFRAGPPIQQLLAEARANAVQKGIAWKGLIVEVSDADRVAGFSASSASNTYTRLACSADLIAVGHVTSSASHLSSHGLVYTDYLFVIDNLLLDRQPGSPRKSSIVVTRKGGSTYVNSDPVRFQFESSPELNPGETYLQFLRFLPQSSSYQAVDTFSTLRKTDNSWALFRASLAPTVSGLTTNSVESTVTHWLSSCF